MSIADDLLAHAEDMLSGPGAANPAVLRRAVSTAYYALFHLLVGDATALLCPARPASLPAAVRRGFHHSGMRDLCKGIAKGSIANLSDAVRPVFSDPLEIELVVVARAFLDLQSSRHQAGYAVDELFSFPQAMSPVQKAREAFTFWQAIKTTDNAYAFCTALLLQRSWRSD